MSQEQPKHFGKWEGEVIKVLVSMDNEFVNFKILQTKTGLTPNDLKMALHNLYDEKVIQKDGDRYLLVNVDVKKQWKAFLEAELSRKSDQNKPVRPSAQEAKQVPEQNPSKSDNELVQWLLKWVADKHIDVAAESKHFFLEGMRLEELARDLIEKAQFDIFVTSPFVDSCYLVTALQEAKARRVTVKLVARRPENVKEDRQKIDCQANLKRSGIVIHYINQIHAKIIVVDSKIAIISSMNLYSGSTGGALFEAGVVSFEKKVVDAATKYISGLLERPESTDEATTSRFYKRRY